MQQLQTKFLWSPHRGVSHLQHIIFDIRRIFDGQKPQYLLFFETG